MTAGDLFYLELTPLVQTGQLTPRQATARFLAEGPTYPFYDGFLCQSNSNGECVDSWTDADVLHEFTAIAGSAPSKTNYGTGTGPTDAAILASAAQRSIQVPPATKAPVSSFLEREAARIAGEAGTREGLPNLQATEANCPGCQPGAASMSFLTGNLPVAPAAPSGGLLDVLIGGATGFITGGPGGAVLGALGGLSAGGGSSSSSSGLQGGAGSGAGVQSCPTGYVLDPSSGLCKELGAGGAIARYLPGGDTGYAPQSGGLVFGAHAPTTTTRRVCGPGYLLAIDGQCYPRQLLPAALRANKARKAVVSWSDGRTIRKARTVSNRIERLAGALTCKPKKRKR